jgi:hypothetical protein
MRLADTAEDDLGEAQLVYLADKLVLGDRLVSLDERFAARLAQVGDDPAAHEGVLLRLEEARLVQARVERALGRPLGLAPPA